MDPFRAKCWDCGSAVSVTCSAFVPVTRSAFVPGERSPGDGAGFFWGRAADDWPVPAPTTPTRTIPP